MSYNAITPQAAPGESSLDIVWASPANAGEEGLAFSPTGREIVLVLISGSAAGCTINVLGKADRMGRSADLTTGVTSATKVYTFGPLSLEAFRQSDGKVHITYTAGGGTLTSVKIAVLRY